MRVIQVTDEDCLDLLDRLELAKFKGPNIDEGATHRQRVVETHRHFHFVVCNWLQGHGARIARP